MLPLNHEIIAALSAAVHPLRFCPFATTGARQSWKGCSMPLSLSLWDDRDLSQITSNPLPPRQRKTGSVGVAAGPEVAIMDEGGTLLPAGEIGEIVVRGANVFQGYETIQTANRRPSRMAGSGRVTRDIWMPMAICSSPAASRRSSTVVGKSCPTGSGRCAHGASRSGASGDLCGAPRPMG